MKLLIPPPAQFLIAVAAMWAISRYIPGPSVGFIGQSILGYGLIALALLLIFAAIGRFRKAKTTVTPISPEKASALVISGPNRFSRNPMYVGLLLFLTGIAINFGAVWNIGILVLFVIYITQFQIKPEEEHLERLFGDEYRAYKQQVRRWI